MIVNIVSKTTYTLSDVVKVSSYELNQDSDYNGKTEIVLHRKPKAEEEDFILLHDGGTSFAGIISTIENDHGFNSYRLTVIEMVRLFDQMIVLDNESLLATGIEDFIADQIKQNFISSADTMLNIPYLTVTAKTHTPVAAAVDAENGIYNLCTYIGNALTTYGIFIGFAFTSESLNIVIENRQQTSFDIDTGIADITAVDEVYSVKALTKLTVLWQKDENSAVTTRHFFLKTDRTITENMNDPDRAAGTSNVIFTAAATEEEMKQEAKNQFTSNSYQHKIEFDVIRSSRLIPEAALYVGHKCRVKTKNGIKDSMISGVNRSNGSSTISVTLGQLKITLIDKITKGINR